MDLRILRELIAIDSPSGFTDAAVRYIISEAEKLGLQAHKTRKGAVKINLSENPRLVLAAHLDTLGLIVSGINANGTLSFSPIGSPSLNDIEGEHVRVYTLGGKVFTGTVYLDNPAKHANANLSTTVRTPENMHVLLDEEVFSKNAVKALGISVGDFIALETNYREMPSGYIKSRFLDNKIACLVLLEVARYFVERRQKPPISLFFSNYEEVGHGAAGGYEESIEEMLVLDMGVVGNACEGNELFCSICAKDSSGPYDYAMRTKLTQLAEKNNIAYRTDVYPYYSSDGSAAWRAGGQFRVALIGAGVAASHGSERAHVKGIEASIQLCIAYAEEAMKMV
jgi:putative aminopeptidase FrvX